jgi:hypothetical protein
MKMVVEEILKALIGGLAGVLLTAGGPWVWSYVSGPSLLYVEAQNTGNPSKGGPQAVVTLFNVSGRDLSKARVELSPKVKPGAVTVSAAGNNNFGKQDKLSWDVDADGAITLHMSNFPKRSKVSAFIVSGSEFRLGDSAGRVLVYEGDDSLKVAKLKTEIVRTPFDRWAYGAAGLVGGAAGLSVLLWLRRRTWTGGAALTV